MVGEHHHVLIISSTGVMDFPLGKCICPSIVLSLQVVNLYIVMGKFQHFPGYFPTDLLWVALILQIVVICSHYYFMWGSNQ